MEEAVVFDFSLLRGRIREFYQSEKRFTEVIRESNIGMSTGAFNNKINGKTNFTATEIYVMCQLLHIPLEKMHKYFFIKKYEFNS